MDDQASLVQTVLKERGILIKRDEIQSAFRGPDRDANASWVSKHLRDDTLLSKDELALYSKLENSGTLPDTAHNLDIEATRAVLDEDVQVAIESLNASTSALEQQTEILKFQLETLSKQSFLGDDRWASQQSGNLALLRKKHASGGQTVNAATSDLTRELDESLKRETEKTTADGRKILGFLTSRLKEDDRKLVNLEALAAQIMPTGNDSSIMKQTSQLSDILAEYVAQALYSRLDRLYLAAIRTDERDSDGSSSEADEAVAALEEDLESLYQEVGIMAQMYTTQQFNNPILHELYNHCSPKHLASHKTLSSILEMVTEMTSSMESDAARLQDRQSFCEALRALAALYQTEIPDQSVDHLSDRDNPRRRSMQPALPSPARRSSTQTPELQTLESLFRRIGLSSMSVLQPEEPNRSVSLLYEKKLHMRECVTRLDVSADPTLASILASADCAKQQLSSALNSNAGFEVTLSNTDLERQLSALEARLGLVQKGAENLSPDVLYQRDQAREKFVDRWG